MGQEMVLSRQDAANHFFILFSHWNFVEHDGSELPVFLALSTGVFKGNA